MVVQHLLRRMFQRWCCSAVLKRKLLFNLEWERFSMPSQESAISPPGKLFDNDIVLLRDFSHFKIQIGENGWTFPHNKCFRNFLFWNIIHKWVGGKVCWGISGKGMWWVVVDAGPVKLLALSHIVQGPSNPTHHMPINFSANIFWPASSSGPPGFTPS